MKKYKEIRDKIKSLNNGWDKTVDDILNELNTPEGIIILNGKRYHVYLQIPIGEVTGELVIGNLSKPTEILATFSYNSQCNKNTALQQALIWLLYHSNFNTNKKSPTLGQPEENNQFLDKHINKSI